MSTHSALHFAFAALFPLLAVAWDKGETLPVPIRQVQPEYEAGLAKAYLLDHLRAEITIDAAGLPFSVVAKTGLPDNVVKAISQWQFRPGRKRGKDVEFSMVMKLSLRRAIARDVEGVYRRGSSPAAKDVGEALGTGAALDAHGVSQLLETIDRGAQSIDLCAMLVSYWANAESAGEDALKARANQIAWLAEYAPDAGLAGSPFVLINANAGHLQDPVGYSRTREIWLRQAALDPQNLVILEHALNFLEVADGEKAEQLAQPLASELDEVVGWIGEVYGLAALGVTAVDLKTGLPAVASERLPDTPFSQKARNALLNADDPRMVMFGLSAIIRGGRSLAKSGHLPAGYAEFCGTLLDRAKHMQPAISSSCDPSLSLPDENPTVSTIHVGGTTQQARIVKQFLPTYPKEAQSKGIQGIVRFNAIIDKDGKVRSLELISGAFALYESARDAVWQWVYTPTLLNGEPVGVDTVIDVT